MICPNLNDKTVKQQFTELVNAVGEVAAYDIWNQNNGNAIDKAPNGAESKLFSDLLNYYNGDRDSAIKAKAQVYSKSFKIWFGDWTKRYTDYKYKDLALEYFKDNSTYAEERKILSENKDALSLYDAAFEYISSTDSSNKNFGFLKNDTNTKKQLIDRMFGDKAYQITYFVADPVEDIQFDIDTDIYEEAMVEYYSLKKKFPELNLQFENYKTLKKEYSDRYNKALTFLQQSDMFQSI